MVQPTSYKYAGQYSWTDIDGNTFQLPPALIAGSGAVAASGSLPIQTASAGTEVDLDFRPHGIVQGIVYLMVMNLTGQELNMAWQGNYFPHLPDGGKIIFAFPEGATAGQITALRFMLTKDQTSLGYIKFAVVGS